jgi:hypothetical protein
MRRDPLEDDLDEISLQIGRLQLHVRLRPAAGPETAVPAPERPARGGRRTAPVEQPAEPAPEPAGRGRGSRQPTGIGAQWAAREEAARELGVRARRLLDGLPAGPVPEKATDHSNAIWVYARDSAGRTLDPVHFYRRWGDARPFFGGRCICHGFPSQREGRAFAEAAGLRWPEA